MDSYLRDKYIGPPNPIITKSIEGSDKVEFTLKTDCLNGRLSNQSPYDK